MIQLFIYKLSNTTTVSISVKSQLRRTVTSNDFSFYCDFVTCSDNVLMMLLLSAGISNIDLKLYINDFLGGPIDLFKFLPDNVNNTVIILNLYSVWRKQRIQTHLSAINDLHRRCFNEKGSFIIFRERCHSFQHFVIMYG